MRLPGKVALVTGSTQGIGKAIAERYAAEGAVVAIVSSHSLERAEGVAAAIRDNGGNAQAFVADCAKVAEIRRLAGEVSRHLGGVDILVNNAGIITQLRSRRRPKRNGTRSLTSISRAPSSSLKPACRSSGATGAAR